VYITDESIKDDIDDDRIIMICEVALTQAMGMTNSHRARMTMPEIARCTGRHGYLYAVAGT